ncbi:hypothetical protein P879_00292 [Paragonimus westermani]|uniref:Copine C-terminal domain-containing protein n=1 Tax=Paragonimus westermani TaxID=34504 RepID=A0A8T0DY61_9TREM|nr:hypothetical protein P879_00292 [Paragonimus westermani]
MTLDVPGSGFQFTFFHCWHRTSINVVVGVDLSSHATSNTQLPASRQIKMAQSCNEYGVAIQAVMEILQEYDSILVVTKLSFLLQSGDTNNYFCKGMAGVLEAYRRSFEAVHISGPVCFSPIIRDVSE